MHHGQHRSVSPIGRCGKAAAGVRSRRRGGILKGKNFHVGAHAHDLNDYPVYNDNTGVLYYDKDGDGSKPQVKIAEFDHAPHLTTGDFYLTDGIF